MWKFFRKEKVKNVSQFDIEDIDTSPGWTRDDVPKIIVKRPLILVESPYSGDEKLNRLYLEACLWDCILRGEAPFASHMFYTQFMDDDIAWQRSLGIDMGLSIGACFDKTAVYQDMGISDGMQDGISRALIDGRVIQFRMLFSGNTRVYTRLLRKEIKNTRSKVGRLLSTS